MKMSGRDFKLFLAAHKSQIGQQGKGIYSWFGMVWLIISCCRNLLVLEVLVIWNLLIF